MTRKGKSIRFMFSKSAIFCGLMLLSFLSGKAQNVTSPYSILGIGDVDTRDYGRFFGSGSASLARRSEYAYNYANPASLTELPFKTMHFDVALRGRSSTFHTPFADTLTSPDKDFVVKRVTMAFKLNNHTAFAFGLRPYSTVNYSFIQQVNILDGNTSYKKYVDGSGGINMVYFSLAHTLGQHVSVGLTGSWMFGSLVNKTQYLGDNITLTILRKETDFYYGANLQGGLQWYPKWGRNWKHHFGFTAGLATNLHGQLYTEYLQDTTHVLTNWGPVHYFKLPMSYGFGYSLKIHDVLSISLDGNYYAWKQQTINYGNSYTAPSARVSLGVDYSFRKRAFGSVFERSYLAAGVVAEQHYIRILGNPLMDYAVSVGGGYLLSRKMMLQAGIEVGRKGTLSQGQIQESYTQFMIGLTVKDIWIGPKYTRRYD
jgi:hypothetical protein